MKTLLTIGVLGLTLGLGACTVGYGADGKAVLGIGLDSYDPQNLAGGLANAAVAFGFPQIATGIGALGGILGAFGLTKANGEKKAKIAADQAWDESENRALRSVAAATTVAQGSTSL